MTTYTVAHFLKDYQETKRMSTPKDVLTCKSEVDTDTTI